MTTMSMTIIYIKILVCKLLLSLWAFHYGFYLYVYIKYVGIEQHLKFL